MGGAELARLGDDSLKSHLVDSAMVAHQSYAPFSEQLLTDFLDNRNMVRYPVTLSFELGSLAAHQFAQPEPNGKGFTLYLHPDLKNRHEDVIRALAYFLPVMNFGELVNDDHCLLYGATLIGTTVDEYYAQLCRMADNIGAPSLARGTSGDRF
jgi:hypothetical protein